MLRDKKMIWFGCLTLHGCPMQESERRLRDLLAGKKPQGGGGGGGDAAAVAPSVGSNKKSVAARGPSCSYSRHDDMPTHVRSRNRMPPRA